MYSRNDYRYYLENRLMHSDDFLAHYGVQGMHWGVRKDAYTRLSERRNSNNAKIAKYQEKLNTTSSKNRSAKAAHYKAKQDKYDQKAAKARSKLSKGKKLSKGEIRKISKAESYRHKVAKNSIKNDKLQSKINKYEAKNIKIDKKIAKLDNKANREKLLNSVPSDVPMSKRRSNYDATMKSQVKTFKKNMPSLAPYINPVATEVDNLGRVTSLDFHIDGERYIKDRGNY